MADKSFVMSPAECMAEPKTKGGPGEYNGEPGLQKRTMGPNSQPEKTYEPWDPKGDSSTGTFVSTPSKPPFGK